MVKKSKGKSRSFDLATAEAAATAQAAAHVLQSATDHWNTSGKGHHAVGSRFTDEHIASELEARGLRVVRNHKNLARSPLKSKEVLLAQLATWVNLNSS